MLRIRDVYPGSRIRIFPSRIQGQKDFGSVSASKLLVFLALKNVSNLAEKLSRMFIPDPGSGSFSKPDPGSRGKKAPDPGSASRIWIRNCRFCLNFNWDCHLRKHKSRGSGGGPGLTHYHGGTPRVQVQLQQVPAAQILKCWFDSYHIQRFLEALYSDIKLQIGLYVRTFLVLKGLYFLYAMVIH